MEAVISIVGSILGSLAGKAAEYTVDPVARQISYLFKHKSKCQNLRGQLQQLKDARERVQQDVNEADRQGEEIFSNVDKWLTEANRTICEEAVAQLEEDEENAKQRCFVGLCPNFKSRYQLSRKAEKEANAIAELLKEKDRFNRVSYRIAPEGIATRPVKEYEDFESRAGVFDAVMEALKDANLRKIGVYGMGGVGKTTLVKQVARQAKEENLFDEVVMAAVTQSFDIKKIQDQIADELGLKFDKQSDSGRAGELRNRLKKNKKVLVILDDIWVKLDMEALGIPYGGEHQGCKILLTSRELNVLSLMGLEKEVKIEILEEEEAWKLFKKMAGDIALSPDLQSTAIEVAKKCARLPIAISTVGKAMKNKKNLFEWKNVLQELRRPSKRNFKGIPADVYSAIELSYKFLEVEEHGPTFLLCSIMGHDAAIEDLLKYGMGLGLFHGVNTIEETRNKAFTLVTNLKNSSLLLDGSTSERFDMHDVVRDVAISIASRDKHWLVGRDDESKELSNEETMRNCNLIRLQYAKVSELLDHEQLECPNLTFFSLGSEDFSLKISNNFFKGMQKLRVLDFSKLHFSSLPLTFCFLRSVRTLRFSNCILKDIVIIGELKNLEILSLRGSEIAELPCEIGQLTNLKLLDLSDCEDLRVIAPDVLSRLSKLEELYLYGSFDRWEVEGHEKPKANASLVELQNLSHLTTLEVHIPDEEALPKELFSEKLESFKISIGERWSRYEKSKNSRKLKLKLNNKSIHLYDNGVKTLLRKTETLELNAGKDAMDMFYDPNIEGIPHLKHLLVRRDPEVKYIFQSVFPLLESLILWNLINLEVICYGQLKAECFGQLRRIEVVDCDMLKNFFSFAIARELGQLQKIEVRECKNLTELIIKKREEEIDDDDILDFSQLSSLRLKGLPSLTCLLSSEKKVSSSQQESVQSIDKRSFATSFFHQKVEFTGIKELILGSIPIEKLWHDQLPVMSAGVQNLTTLEVKGCGNLKNLFTSSMVNNFVQLKTLVVEHCNKMEEVLAVTKGLVEDQERNGKMVFPKLNYLSLERLPNLKRFSSGNPIEFPFLSELWMSKCPVLDTFHCDSTSVATTVENEAEKSSISIENLSIEISKYLFNEKVALPMLERLEIYSMENLQRLWPNQLAEDSFSKLIRFELKKCDKLLNVFPLSMLTRLRRLERLGIWDCDLLEEIFESQEEGSSSSSSSATRSLSPQLIQSSVVEENFTFGFPQLTYLELAGLPKLKSFGHRIHITNWPSLKEIVVYGCHKVETFAYEDMRICETDRKDQQEIPMQQPLFWINKLAFLNLQELTIGRNDGMKEILHGQLLASDYFCKLKLLRLVQYPKKVAKFPSYLFQLLSLPNLESLQIDFCDLKEMVFQSEGVGGEEKPASAWMAHSRLTELQLFCLDELMYLWNEPDGFQNLRKLCVIRCPKLKRNLVPSSVRFQNLMILQVDICGGIIKLVTHSTAKSLMRLREMRISDCEKIEEIIEGSDGDNDEVKDEISFPQLNLLELVRLPKLESFCSSGNLTFGFPSLATVVVDNCPKMKMFSQGGLNAPMLHKV